MTPTYLGLGSNLGNRAGFLEEALDRLATWPGVRLGAISSIYETRPVGLINQPNFLNLAVRIESELGALEVLRMCQSIESSLGRERDMRWGPRTVDLDVLLHGDETHQTPELMIPHPRMQERAFVLVPLAEIAPQLILAGTILSDRAATCDQSGVWHWSGPPPRKGGS